MKKRRSAEQIVGLLWQADVDLGKGMRVPDVCRRLGISQRTYDRRRAKFRGMDHEDGQAVSGTPERELEAWGVTWR